MALTWTPKRPAAVLDYSWEVPVEEGDTLASASLTKVSGSVMIDSQSTIDNLRVAWLSGGVDGETAEFRGQATTTAGRTFDETIYLPIVTNVPIVSLADAKAHLRVRHNDEDDLISAYIDAATATIDGPDGWLGRAVSVQVIEQRFDCFAAGVCLLYPPIIEIVSVKYLDSNGALQTLATDQYELIDRDVVPVVGASWPSALARRDSVRVQYRAGYASVPKPIQMAILLMVGDLYACRETVGSNLGSIPMSTTVESLLSPFRIYA
jgi:uncharacterized phiE125 gp8 family phage protein